jgi:hypothetical protein
MMSLIAQREKTLNTKFSDKGRKRINIFDEIGFLGERRGSRNLGEILYNFLVCLSQLFEYYSQAQGDIFVAQADSYWSFQSQ